MLPPSLAQAGDESVLEFERMVGVFGPLLGAANSIRDVNGGGAPWVLERGRSELRSNGDLRVKEEELIIPKSAGRGFNQAAFFRAAVICLSIDEAGLPVFHTVFTKNGAEVMEADPTLGAARIEEKLVQTDPSVAPVGFETSPSGSWLAITGLFMEPVEPLPTL